MPRQRRRELIVELIRKGGVSSQEDLVEALAGRGEHATQATVSRDLAAIGVLKTRDGYALPQDPMPGSVGPRGDGSELEATLRRHAVGVVSADSIVVVRTAPGHAGLVGVALDRWPPPDVVGTIAGDDTLFIATQSRTAAQRLASKLDSILHAAGSAA